MMPRLMRVTSLTIVTAIVVCHPGIGRPQAQAVSWLDEPNPASWNKPGLPIPAAARIQGNVDPRCKDLARPPELEADQRLRDQGWDLVGPYQGGWQILVIRGTASYDGMCRPMQYQVFVFVRGVFAGTLSPAPMNSRTDGALNQVTLRGSDQLTAEYLRYTSKDALCCPSSTTTVAFEIASDDTVLRPVSGSTLPEK